MEAKVFATISAVGGLVLHLMGYVSHIFYLGGLGVDSSLFPQKTDETIILGYYTLIDRTATIFTAITPTQLWKLLGIGLLVTLYVFAVIRIARSPSSNKAFHIIRKIPAWLNDLGKSFLLTFLALAGVPVALLLVVFILTIPAIFGESFGKEQAEHQLKKYTHGCAQAAPTSVCIELCKTDKLLARGFLIEGSESHIAIFDINQKRALTFERDGTQLFADSPRILNEKNGITNEPNTSCLQKLSAISTKNSIHTQ